MTALDDMKGSMADAVKDLSDILNLKGIVRPVSVTKSTLCAMFEDGTVIKGESNIDLCKGRSGDLGIKRCWHEPPSRCDVDAFSSIINSDFVTIGPGDLFTSVVTNFLVKDIARAITRTKAKKFIYAT